MPRKKAPEIKKTIDPNVVGLKAEVISQPSPRRWSKTICRMR